MPRPHHRKLYEMVDSSFNHCQHDNYKYVIWWVLGTILLSFHLYSFPSVKETQNRSSGLSIIFFFFNQTTAFVKRKMSTETVYNDDAQWETMTSRRNRKSAKKDVVKKASNPVASRTSAKDDKKKRMRGGRSKKSEFDPLALYVLSLLTPFVAASIGKKPQYEASREQQQEQERQLDLPLSRGHNNNHTTNNNQGNNVDRWMVFSSSFDRSSGRGLDEKDYLSFIRPTEYSFASYNDFLRCWQSAVRILLFSRSTLLSTHLLFTSPSHSLSVG